MPASTASADKIEQFMCIAVIGGFEPDSMRGEVECKVGESKDVRGVEEIYVYRRGSIGFVRFCTADAMSKFLEKFNYEENTSQNTKAGKSGPQHQGVQRTARRESCLQFGRK